MLSLAPSARTLARSRTNCQVRCSELKSVHVCVRARASVLMRVYDCLLYEVALLP